MALIPPETIEAIRSKLDIVELVSDYVPGLSRAGRNMKGRCPFHQERTPSFIVSPERQTFHCFGCGEGGDAFTFVMKIESLGFGEAVEKLAERAGVKIVVQQEPLGPQQIERLKLKEALEFAASFYHGALLDGAPGEPARRYLESRRVSAGSVKGFGLGYAPRTSALLAAAARRGFGAELLVKAGLVVARDGRARDYFFDRVLYPIRDGKGIVVGFGGRALGDAQPKYLNTPETPMFSKGRVLYGLFEGLSSVRKSRRALLMEGYMDVIAAHQHGLVTACAPLGTALTPDHAASLKRYADDVVIVFDADSAGLSAAIRGAEILLAAGLGVKIATVPEGKDPDEFLHKNGAEAFAKDCLEKAVDLPEFKTELLLSKEKPPARALPPERKSAIAQKVLETIEQCPDEIRKGEWYRRLAQRLDVSEESFRLAGRKISSRDQRRPREASVPGPAGSGEMSQTDRQLLEMMLRAPACSKSAGEEDFSSEQARAVWSAIRSQEPWERGWTARFLDGLKGRAALASALVVGSEKYDDSVVASEIERIIKKNRINIRLKELEPLILTMEGGVRADAALRQEYQRLLADLKGSSR